MIKKKLINCGWIALATAILLVLLNINDASVGRWAILSLTFSGIYLFSDAVAILHAYAVDKNFCETDSMQDIVSQFCVSALLVMMPTIAIMQSTRATF